MAEKKTVLANPYFLFILLTIVVLERLFIYHKFGDAWTKVVAVDLIFLIPTIAISLFYAQVKGRNILWEIVSEPKNLPDLVGDIKWGLVAGIGLATFAVSGGFSAIGLPEFNALDSVDSEMNSLRYALIPIGAEVSSFLILGIFAFYIMHVALNEELFAAVTTKIIDPHPDIDNPRTLKALALRSVSFASLHIYVWKLTQLNYFASAFLVSFAVFGSLFVMRGIVAAIVAHGTYNALVDIILKTGLQPLLLTMVKLMIVVGVVYYLYKKLRSG